MHGVLPKGSSFYAVLNTWSRVSPDTPSPYIYSTGPWFCREVEECEIDKIPSFFREHRRRDFSDVVHAKRLTTGHKKSELLFNNLSGPTTVRQLRSGAQRFIVAWDDTLSWHEFVQNDVPRDWGGFCTVQCDGKLAICIYASGFVDDNGSSGDTGYFTVSVYLGRYVSDRSSTQIYVREFVNLRGGSCTLNADGTKTYSSSIPKWLQVAINYCFHNFPGYGHFMSYLRDLGDEIYNVLEQEAFIGKISSYSAWKQVSITVSPTRYDSGVFSPLEEYMHPSYAFKLHEPEVILDGYDDVMFGRGTEAYWRNYLIEKAYLAAVQSIPRMNDNNISNMLEIASFIKSLVIDHKVEIPKSLNDYWLAYRYSYSTSKSDVDDAIHFMHRQCELGQWESLKCRGSSSHVLEDGTNVVCRCTLAIEPKELTLLKKVWRSLYTFGLTPSFYVVWDMIPYSFIVDWLIPVGDIVASWDTEREFTTNYDIKSLIFSLSYDASDNGLYVNHYYTRWRANTPPQLHGYYFFEDDPSSATVGKRILDAIALTVHLPSP